MEVILNWDETWGWGIIKDTIINPGKKKTGFELKWGGINMTVN